ncbi:MAG TPA: hypothetical protein PLC08_01475 [Candidatus Bipolaricaulis sp.]|nr:hypothetical protein [Candidatus Bipolaricaulis sp.]HRS13996.1 hypothetical protein [Candidatus Bipolaricaulis sp.]HRU21931.1 hypothetical protein [Candidatus Bipolaricaulis sp.]
MKRALAIAVALCTLGIAGFSQITGSWSADLCLDGTITSDLKLCYNVSGLDICSVSGFGATGWATQKFTLAGGFGPFSLSGSMTFSPSDVSYTKSDVTTKFDFAGIALSLKVEHWATQQGFCDGGPANLRYTLTGTVAPITLKLTFIDCCTGTEFYSLLATMKMPLCCGIVLDAEFSFLKTGFEYLSFSGIRVPICCGIYVDLGVKFTVDTKLVTAEWGFEGLDVGGCFEVYAAPVIDKTDDFLTGLAVAGFKISCEFSECNSVEFVTFLDPEAADDYDYDFLTACGEFEYIGLTFCGAACCGGQYNGSLQIYFGANGGLFDVTRILAEFSIPLMQNFTLDITTNIPAATCAGTATTCFGFTFTF